MKILKQSIVRSNIISYLWDADIVCRVAGIGRNSWGTYVDYIPDARLRLTLVPVATGENMDGFASKCITRTSGLSLTAIGVCHLLMDPSRQHSRKRCLNRRNLVYLQSIRPLFHVSVLLK